MSAAPAHEEHTSRRRPGDAVAPPAGTSVGANALAPDHLAPDHLAPDHLGDAAARVRELQSRIRGMEATKLDTRAVPTLAPLRPLFLGGAMQQGAVYTVRGSVALATALMAGASAAGSWCAVVGVPDFGVEAAAGMGVALDRLVLVPRPGDQWLAVVSALLDALPLVVVRPTAAAAPGDATASRIAARLRQRGATMLVLGPWPGADAELAVTRTAWHGLGDGHGYLGAREVEVGATTRSRGTRRARFVLQDGDGRVDEVLVSGDAAPDTRHVGAAPSAGTRAPLRAAP